MKRPAPIILTFAFLVSTLAGCGHQFLGPEFTVRTYNSATGEGTVATNVNRLTGAVRFNGYANVDSVAYISFDQGEPNTVRPGDWYMLEAPGYGTHTFEANVYRESRGGGVEDYIGHVKGTFHVDPIHRTSPISHTWWMLVIDAPEQEFPVQ